MTDTTVPAPAGDTTPAEAIALATAGVHGQLENIIYSYAGTLMHGSTDQRCEAVSTIMAVADGLIPAAAPLIAARAAAAQLQRDIKLAISEHAVYERWVKGADGCSRIHQIPFADLLAAQDTPTTTEETR